MPWRPSPMLGVTRQQEALAVAIGLDDALLGWLVASAGDGLVRRLRSDPVRAALRTVVEEAVTATVGEILGGRDNDQAEHLRACLLARNLVADHEQTQASKAELRDELRHWTAALDRPEFGGPGYLTGLGIDSASLADTLMSRIIDGIRRNGRSGGVLNPIAEWLWRDDLSTDVTEIKRAVTGPAEAERSRRGNPDAVPHQLPPVPVDSPDGSVSWRNSRLEAARD